MRKQILFVDDEQPVLDSLHRMLRAQRDVWEMSFVPRALQAWELLMEGDFDAVVLDISMPGMSGLQLLKRIQRTRRTRNIPVVMLTGLENRGLKRQALDLGAADLLNKPAEPEDLLARLRSVLRLKSYQDELNTHNHRLERTVRERTAELSQSRLDMIWRLGKAAEQRDEETGNHVVRVGCLSRVVAESIGLDEQRLETLFLAAPLHDIGKIGIPDAILRKRGPLSPGQWTAMREHCVIGARILREDSKMAVAFRIWRGLPAETSPADAKNPFLETAATVALEHHEKWDGTGYPRGLAGEQISLESRIVAICDVFDAITSQRPYRKPCSLDDALEIIRKGAGTHFDPAVHEAFLAALAEVKRIKNRFSDGVEILSEPETVQDEERLVC